MVIVREVLVETILAPNEPDEEVIVAGIFMVVESERVDMESAIVFPSESY